MRRRAKIGVYGEPAILNTILDRIKHEVVEGRITGNYLQVRIYEETKSYGFLIDELRERKLRYSFSELREYTKKEINNARFFDATFYYPWEHDSITAEDYGTIYSSDGVCTDCGFGKTQASNLTIDKKKVGKYHIVTIMPELIITETVKNLIIENQVFGCEFYPVYDYKGKDEPTLYQLVITNVLPPMSNNIRTEVWNPTNCKSCGKNGVFLRSEVIYHSESLSDAKDFNLSTEYFGENKYCSRKVIVSSRVRDMFNKNKIKVWYEPVSII